MRLYIKLLAAAVLVLTAAQPVQASTVTVMQTETTLAPAGSAIKVTNHYEGSDFVNVAAEMGTTVKVYDAETGGTLLAEGVVGYRSANLELPQGFGSLSAFYVTLTQPNKLESARVARNVPTLPAGPAAEAVVVTHYLGDVVEVQVEQVPAGAFVLLKDPANPSYALASDRNNSSTAGTVTVQVPVQSIYGLSQLNVQFFVASTDDGGSSAYATMAIPAGLSTLSPGTLNINDKITVGDATATHLSMQQAGISFAYHERAADYQSALANARSGSGALLTHGEIQSIVDAVNIQVELNISIREGSEIDLWYTLGNAGILDVNLENASQYQEALRTRQTEAGRGLSLVEIQGIIYDINNAGMQIEADPGDPIGG